jgi:hypothetical protein
VWQGLQSITGYKGKPSLDLPKNASLPDELNAFYACFDNNNIVQGVRVVTDPEDWVISLTEADVSKVFNQVNIRPNRSIDLPQQWSGSRASSSCVQITKWSTHTAQL